MHKEALLRTFLMQGGVHLLRLEGWQTARRSARLHSAQGGQGVAVEGRQRDICRQRCQLGHQRGHGGGAVEQE